jgi:hypothetical protein
MSTRRVVAPHEQRTVGIPVSTDRLPVDLRAFYPLFGTELEVCRTGARFAPQSVDGSVARGPRRSRTLTRSRVFARELRRASRSERDRPRPRPQGLVREHGRRDRDRAAARRPMAPRSQAPFAQVERAAGPSSTRRGTRRPIGETRSCRPRCELSHAADERNVDGSRPGPARSTQLRRCAKSIWLSVSPSSCRTCRGEAERRMKSRSRTARVRERPASAAESVRVRDARAADGSAPDMHESDVAAGGCESLAEVGGLTRGGHASVPPSSRRRSLRQLRDRRWATGAPTTSSPGGRDEVTQVAPETLPRR